MQCAYGKLVRARWEPRPCGLHAPMSPAVETCRRPSTVDSQMTLLALAFSHLGVCTCNAMAEHDRATGPMARPHLQSTVAMSASVLCHLDIGFEFVTPCFNVHLISAHCRGTNAGR